MTRSAGHPFRFRSQIRREKGVHKSNTMKWHVASSFSLFFYTVVSKAVKLFRRATQKPVWKIEETFLMHRTFFPLIFSVSVSLRNSFHSFRFLLPHFKLVFSFFKISPFSPSVWRLATFKSWKFTYALNTFFPFWIFFKIVAARKTFGSAVLKQ